MTRSRLSVLCVSAGLVVFAGCKSGPDPDLTNPWFSATYAYNDAGLDAASKSGADINQHNRDHNTPLHEATKLDNAKAVQYFVAHGADVNARDEDQQTPLHFACDEGKAAAGKELIAAGANVNARDEDQKTPLMFAVDDGYMELVKAILDTGKADPNLVDKDGYTALHYAAEAGQVESVRLLLERHADPTVRDKKDRTPLMVAIREKQVGCIAVLQAVAGPATPITPPGSAVPTVPATQSDKALTR